MFSRRFVVRSVACTAVFCQPFLFAQSTAGQPARPSTRISAAYEFPVTMRQNVIAGKTRVGTRVEATLTIATLVKGTVIPMGATFSGEVVESAAKAGSDPSRLAIRMDSVRWKKGSASIPVYLTAWYYPIQMATDEDHSNDLGTPPPGRIRNRNPSGPTPFPGSPTPGSDGPSGPLSKVSENRVVMKDVESTHQGDGVLVLTSSRFNLKLDKTTTYVLATSDLMPRR